jgi:hypothetical protein
LHGKPQRGQILFQFAEFFELNFDGVRFLLARREVDRDRQCYPMTVAEQFSCQWHLERVPIILGNLAVGEEECGLEEAGCDRLFDDGAAARQVPGLLLGCFLETKRRFWP